MRSLAVLLLTVSALLPQGKDAFNAFSYCHEFTSGMYERQCIELKPDGIGQSRLKRRGSEEASTALTLSPNGRDKFLSVLAATRNLEGRQKYESGRRVANLGRKHLKLELPSETREADFNYSDIKEVIALTAFFDGLINQQVIIQELEAATRYERLSLPERLERLEGELKSGRIGDPHGLVPTLDKIIQNEGLLNYARQHAQQMKSQILISR